MRNPSFSALRLGPRPNLRLGLGLSPGLLLILAGLGTFSLASAAAVQAQPSQLSYDYQNGSIAAEAEINPLAGRLLGRILKKEIPSAVTFSATELVGAFTLPETTASIGNGSITFDSSPVKALLEPYLQQAMGQIAQRYSLPEDVGIETLESALNYRLVGEGLLNSLNGSTAFTFEYGDDTDRLAIEGIDPAVLALCQEQTCTTEVDGDFDLKLDVKGFGEASEELGLNLPFSVKRMLKQAQRFGFKEVAFADGKLTSVVQLLPNLAPAVVSEHELLLDKPLTESPVESTTREDMERPQSAPADVVSADVASADEVEPGSKLGDYPTIQSANSRNLRGHHQLTQGDFVLTVERMTAPWSFVYSLPSRD